MNNNIINTGRASSWLNALAAGTKNASANLPMDDSDPGQRRDGSDGEGNNLDLATLIRICANMKFIHVLTRRYSAHATLDDAFESMFEHMDLLLEAIQGKHGDLPVTNMPDSFENPGDGDGKILEACKRLEGEFRTATEAFCDNDPALGSARDNIVLDFYQVYYRLRRKG